ncbi:hypothetical protein [Stenotrophomonas sp. UBA7606]|nr:hypothetical protein [Stenotrophomonas sp. UBA7606]
MSIRHIKVWLRRFPSTREYVLACDLTAYSLIALAVIVLPVQLLQLAGGL